MIGVGRGKVKLLPYDPKWKKSFENEKNKLKNFGQIEHIGSTAVPGLYAKPIIDIAIGVDSLKNNEVEKYKKPLADIEYKYVREERPDEHLFVKGPEELRTHYLHMIEINSKAWKDYILFRNYLIDNPEVREKYTKLKKELSKKFAEDRKSYTAGKIDLVQKIIKQANEK
ncbi:GrpB family protein [Candidatus Parcubacteria bacterium]|nr:MAG: GrpB family protein [Candidatus Parcubacteria bacterium]